MKKLLLFTVVGLVVLAVGVNWYYTRQIRDQLDRMANAVSMFGTLSYDSVRLSPGGAININALSFRLHEGRGGVDIGRISLRTANLMALLSLESQLERGRLPEALGLSIEGIRFPLDGALATMAREVPGSRSPSGSTSLLLAAEGCDGRTRFSANDLMHMDYFDIRADVEARYQFIDNGNSLRVSASARTEDASAIQVSATFDLLSGTLSVRDLARSMQNARLGSFSLEYEDLGYYERMLAFCAEEMSMSRSEYIAHHLQAWKQAWTRFDARPGRETVAAYEAFLEEPQQLSISSNSETGVAIDAVDHYAISDLLERMDVRLMVNHGAPQPLDFRSAGESPANVASTQRPPGAGSAVASPESEAAPATSPAAGAEADAPPKAAAQSASRWVEVDPGEIAAHRGQRVRVRMDSGDRYAGRLTRVDSDNIHIRVEGVGGFHVRPLSRGEIRDVEAYDDR